MQKKIALIGLGNAGCNVVKRYGDKYPGTAERILINTSTTDMSKFTPADYDYSIRMGELDGTGGNHEVAKNVAMNLMQTKILGDAQFIDLITDKEYVFVIGSSAGGTGSGMLPVLYQVLTKVVRVAEKFIAVCILPEEGLTVDRLDNVLLNQSELYSDPDATYMVYDNSRYDIKSSYELKEKINDEIVDDLFVFTGLDLLQSKYNNIDAEDMLALMSLPGRIVIVRCDSNRQINHGNIEATILNDLETRSAHAILNNDKVVGAYGLIANLSRDSIEGLDESLPTIREKIGEPVSTYMNLSDQDSHNKVIFIMTGLAKPSDRLFQLHELLTAKQAKIKVDDTAFTYKDITLASRRRPKTIQTDGDITLSDIFSRLK